MDSNDLDANNGHNRINSRGTSSSASLLESVGAELMGILIPVSSCMLLVVLLVRALFSTSELPSPSIAVLVYDEDPSDSDTRKLEGAFLNALVFVAFVTVATFILVAVFYFRWTRFLRIYMAFSAFTVLAYMGGALSVLLVQAFFIPIDVITFSVLLLNFAVVGMLSVFPVAPVPIFFTQGYLVIIGMLVAFWFTFLPEWTTWVLLLAMAAYDVAAVLLPGGPLKLLVEMAIERNEEIPALVYEARPVSTVRYSSSALVSSGGEAVLSVQQQQQQRGRWRRGPIAVPSSEPFLSRLLNFTGLSSNKADSYQNLVPDDPAATQAVPQQALVSSEILVSATVEPDGSVLELREEEQLARAPSSPEDESVPLVSRHIQPRIDTLSALMSSERAPTQDELGELGTQETSTSTENFQDDETVGIESTTGGGIKLGLGDFIFYSVLVGRAAMFDLMTVYACYLAIVAGLGATLVLLAVWRRALPALPISISLGVLFYFLTRLLMDPFVVQLATHLVFF